MPTAPFAHLGGLLARDLVETADLVTNPERLDAGWWAVVATFEGAITGYRFASVTRAPLPQLQAPWPGISGAWSSSLDRAHYLAGVEAIRRRIAAGDVYQVNLCRMLSAPLGPSNGSAGFDPVALAHRLAAGNPARYQGVVSTGDEWIVTASPELFLGRAADRVVSSPIKGTAPPGAAFAEKDIPENVMITDLVRHDLGQIGVVGSVQVDQLLAREELPGLDHLVSTVSAQLRPDMQWADVLAALLPPGSVSGAPKLSAIRVISSLEPVPRGPYCGAIGYVDADRRRAELAVGIRTFFTASGRLHFGTGAGITYLSDPAAEWDETELKAARLIGLASAAV